ncbi:4519_t:CDS:2 [Cetraspora pellucida]|uniref:4519_t:CDS:1 n=1 Tax=Cetraspora pellucida TaxID=1433469 RepID=A0A9N8ZVJ5_9GLOM|nr:4519_t:CDS:2 [Cetraspora pellucida]
MSVKDQFENDQTVNRDEYNNQQHLTQTTLLLQKIAQKNEHKPTGQLINNLTQKMQQMAINYEKLTITLAELSTLTVVKRTYCSKLLSDQSHNPRRPFTSLDRNRPQYRNVNICDIYLPKPEEEIYAIKQCKVPKAEHSWEDQPIPIEITSDEQTPIMSQPAVLRRRRGPFIVNLAPKYNVAKDLLTTEESNITNNKYNKKSIVAKYYVWIQNNPILVVLDSEAAVIVIANGTQEQALGKIPNMKMAVRSVIIPTSFQVIENPKEYLDKSVKVPIHQAKEDHLVVSQKLNKDDENNFFNNYKKEETKEVKSYCTDNTTNNEDEDPVNADFWKNTYSPAIYLMAIEEFLIPEESSRYITDASSKDSQPLPNLYINC